MRQFLLIFLQNNYRLFEFKSFLNHYVQLRLFPFIGYFSSKKANPYVIQNLSIVAFGSNLFGA